jgi:hypothetical protein
MNIANLLCAGSSTPNRDKPFQWDPNSGISTFLIMSLSTPPDIAAILNITAKRVAYALNNKAPTPKKQTGRPSKLNAEQRQQLVNYVYSSRKTRRITFKELAQEFNYWEVGEEAIKNTLKREGFGV